MHRSFKNKPNYNKWVAAVWARAKECGMNEEAVRAVAFQVSGKPSVSRMSLEQFRAWFKRVDELYPQFAGRRNPAKRGTSKTQHTPRSDSIIEIASAEQLVFIRQYAQNDLGWTLGWNANYTECESISKIIEKHTKGRKWETRLLTKYEARSVIEALKKIWERKKNG